MKHSLTIFFRGAILTLLVLLAALVNAQIMYETNVDGTQSPAWKIQDRFGRNINKLDLKITQLTGGQSILPYSNDCIKQYFHLYFIDPAGTGFNHATLGAARQAVACKVFEDLAAWIQPTNINNQVNIVIGEVPWATPFTSTVLGEGSAIYLYPQTLPCTGIIDGLPWKSIISGTDPYTNTPGFNEYQIGGGNTFAHGVIRVNWAQNFSTLLGAATPSNEYDLYSVMLHEALHMLGITGMITQSGAGGLISTGYSRFDLGLTNNTGAYLINNSLGNNCYCYSYNTAISSTSGCTSIRYRGNGLDLPVYAPAIWADGSSLTHFDNTCTPVAPYVMQPGLAMGVQRRTPELTEGIVMCSLGYNINAAYGVAVSGVINNTRNGYSACTNNPFGIVGADDGVNAGGLITYNVAYNTPFTTSNILNNDFADACANNRPTGFDCLEVLTPGIAVNNLVNNGNGTVTLSPPIGFSGNVVVRYRPLCGTNFGSYAYIYFYVLPAGCTSSISCPATGCNMVCNGDFDAFSTGCDFGCYASNFRTSYPSPFGFQVETLNNTTDVILANASYSCDAGTAGNNTSSNVRYSCPRDPDCYHNPSNPTYNPVANVTPHSGTTCIGISAHGSNLEGISLPLTSTLLTNGTIYTIGFWANTGVACNLGNFFIMNVIGSTNKPCLLSDPVATPFFNYGNTTVCGNSTTFTPIDLGPNSHITINYPTNTPGWAYYSFTYAPSVGTNINYINLIPSPCEALIIIDDISVAPVLTATATTNRTTVCSNSVAQLGVDVSGNPANYTYAWSPTTGLSSSTIRNPLASGFTGPITYTVTVTGCGGTTVSSSVSLGFGSGPTASISPATVSVCIGNSTTLIASGGGTYQWSSNANNATTAAITVSPTANSNYTVTVTSANGCTASAMRTVSVYSNPITLSQSTVSPNQVNGVPFNYNFTVCNSTGQQQTVTVTVPSLPTGLTITNLNGWQNSGSTLSKTVTVPAGGCVDYLTGGLWFTVQPNISLGSPGNCSYASQVITCNSQASSSTTGCSAAVTTSRSITVYSHRVVGSAVGISSLQTAINWGVLSANGTLASQTFTVHGDFAIDVASYQFGISAANSTVQTNVFCYPGAQITINSGKKLTAYWANFNGCTALWKGINVVGTATPGELVLNHCEVNDAQYGVRVTDASKLNLSQSEFNECFIGVYAQSTLSNALVNLTGPFTQNYFFSTGNMKANYPGMINTLGIQPPANTIPSTNRRTWAGIHINGISTLSISSLVFTGTTNGIVSNNCNLSVTASNFNEHHAYGYSFNGIQGHGIYSYADYGIGGIGQPPFVTKSLYERGIGYGPPTCYQTFTNCDNGITATRMHVDVGLNCISATNGITVNNSQRANIRINQNSITATSKGVHLNNNDPVNLTDIGPNEIVMSGTGTNSAGIFMVEQNNPPLQSANVHHNKVFLNGWYGISLTSCSGMGPVPNTPNNYQIYNNTVIVQNPNWVFSCINYEGSHNLESYNNLITGTGASAQAFFGGGTPVGLRASISDGNFSCERPSAINTGIRFEGACNSGPNGCVLRTCEMSNHTIGLHYTNGLIINAQGSTSISNGNRWLGTYTGGNSARSDQPVPSFIHVKGTSAPFYAPAVATVFPSSGFFQSSSGNPPICTGSVGAGFKNGEEGEETTLTDLDEQIINDNLQFDEFEEQLKWQSEKIVYEKLKENTELIEPGSQTAAFFEEKQNSTIGQLSDVEEGRTNAQQPTIYQALQLDVLLHQKEMLMMQLAYADTLIDSTSTSVELNNWQTITANLYASLEQVNNAINQYNQGIGNSLTVNAEELITNNSTINASQQVDNNLKLINDIYLNTVAVGIDTFNSEQLKDLYYVATQCPLAGGEAVYRSRSLLALVVDTAFNDRDICTAAGIAYKKDQTTMLIEAGTDSKLQIHTYPNPANTYLLLQSYIAYTKDLQVSIYDNMGRNVKEQNVSLASKKVKIDLQELSSGLYFLRLMNGSEYIYTTKFNVQH